MIINRAVNYLGALNEKLNTTLPIFVTIQEVRFDAKKATLELETHVNASTVAILILVILKKQIVKPTHFRNAYMAFRNRLYSCHRQHELKRLKHVDIRRSDWFIKLFQPRFSRSEVTGVISTLGTRA